MKECGGLKCAKCGLIRKYVKSYQNHIRDCDELSVSTYDKYLQRLILSLYAKNRQ